MATRQLQADGLTRISPPPARTRPHPQSPAFSHPHSHAQVTLELLHIVCARTLRVAPRREVLENRDHRLDAHLHGR
eukprot:351858-Chlamydomonas_euryale.AAC.1